MEGRVLIWISSKVTCPILAAMGVFRGTQWMVSPTENSRKITFWASRNKGFWKLCSIWKYPLKLKPAKAPLKRYNLPAFRVFCAVKLKETALRCFYISCEKYLDQGSSLVTLGYKVGLYYSYKWTYNPFFKRLFPQGKKKHVNSDRLFLGPTKIDLEIPWWPFYTSNYRRPVKPWEGKFLFKKNKETKRSQTRLLSACSTTPHISKR